MLDDKVNPKPRYVNSGYINGPVKVYTQAEIDAYVKEREGIEQPVKPKSQPTDVPKQRGRRRKDAE